jgi:cyclohexa-1,5-dienecarbonyl-CoA hydratase
MGAEEALATGLVDSVSEDPEATALAYFDQSLATSSASTLRFAVIAARQEYRQRVIAKLERVEDLYLSDLMATHDAVEGLTAFLEKRPARWENC